MVVESLSVLFGRPHLKRLAHNICVSRASEEDDQGSSTSHSGFVRKRSVGLRTAEKIPKMLILWQANIG